MNSLYPEEIKRMETKLKILMHSKNLVDLFNKNAKLKSKKKQRVKTYV